MKSIIQAATVLAVLSIEHAGIDGMHCWLADNYLEIRDDSRGLNRHRPLCRIAIMLGAMIMQQRIPSTTSAYNFQNLAPVRLLELSLQ